MNPYRIFKAFSSGDKNLFKSIRNIFGFYPENVFLYKQALRHKSVVEIKNSIKTSNERLEYLGDAVLSSVIADFLFKKFPYKDEGFLTEMRAKIVSRTHLNKLSEKLGISNLVQTHKDLNGHTNSIHGNAFEALVGAIYLDKGYDFTRKIIVERLIKFHIDIDELETRELNHKSKLIEWAQKERKSFEFRIVDTTHSESNKKYIVEVLINHVVSGKGEGFSIKVAEKNAAEDACNKMNIVN